MSCKMHNNVVIDRKALLPENIFLLKRDLEFEFEWYIMNICIRIEEKKKSAISLESSVEI